jgi:hypothetical protein
LPPLGIASLKGYLEPRGHEVKGIDLNIEYCRERLHELIDDEGGSVYARPDPWLSGSFDEWAFEFDGEVRFRSALRKRPLPIEAWTDEVLADDPQVVGFSVQSACLGVTLQVAQEVRRRKPSVPIVFGGPCVAEAQEGIMALRTGVPDVVVEGEGEETLLELLEAFETGRDLAEVQGIGRLIGGRPRWNERRRLLGDVDALPFPDFSDFDWEKYPNPFEIPIMTSRGCVLSCAFCYETVYWKRYRTQSADRIVAEIQHQIASHPLRADAEAGKARFNMSFADSLVNGHLGGLKRMAEMLIESDTKVVWSGQATINTKMDEDYFDKLGKSGCGGLSFGLESASTTVLESMGKKFQIDEATAFFDRAHRSGIQVSVNVMVGFPTETRADFVQTLRFLTRIRRMVYMVNNVASTAIVGGSRLHDSPEQFGIVPVSIEGWNSGRNYEWSSKAAGSARNRQVRLRILHMWMTLLRIPHQRLGPPPRWAVALQRLRDQRAEKVKEEQAATPMPAEQVDDRLERLTASMGTEPLLVRVTDEVVDTAVPAPEWAAVLSPETWAGCRVPDLSDLVAAQLGSPVTFTPTEEADGTVDVLVEFEHAGPTSLTGMRVLRFARQGGATQMLAFFPITESSTAKA